VEIMVLSEQQYGQTVTDGVAQPTPQWTVGASKTAADIFNNDNRVQALLAGRSYQATGTATYTFGDFHLASMSASFQQRQDIEGDWLVQINFDQRTGKYGTDTIHFKATGVEAINVAIDLNRGEVAWIEPVHGFND
jgi:hypothetical protein